MSRVKLVTERGVIVLDTPLAYVDEVSKTVYISLTSGLLTNIDGLNGAKVKKVYISEFFESFSEEPYTVLVSPYRYDVNNFKVIGSDDEYY